MQFLHTVHCIIFNNFYNQHWIWYLFHLLEVHESYFIYMVMNRNKETGARYDYVMAIKQQIINVNGKYQRN